MEYAITIKPRYVEEIRHRRKLFEIRTRVPKDLRMDILTAILAHEIGTMSFMMTEVTEGERQFYKAVEYIARERIPDDLLQMLERNHAYERAHMMLLQLGFNA